MRTPTSCTQCRRAKRRCIRSGANEDCAPCQRRRLVCEGLRRIHLVNRQTIVARSSTTTVSTLEQPERNPGCQNGSKRDLDLPHGTAVELVEHYLDKFHGRPSSIFHPATLRLMVRKNALSRALLYAICAIGCKFSVNPDTRGQGLKLAAESKRLLQGDIENVCLENIQTCILIATLSVGHGNSSSEVLFFRIAAAMAEIMNLNSAVSTVSVVEREVKRRVWWSLYMTDMWCISGQGLQSQLKDVQANIDLPMNDETFMALDPEHSTVSVRPGPGIWAHMTTLVPFFGTIHNINRRVANGETQSAHLDLMVEQLASRLENWRDQLPIDARMNPENLLQQQGRGLGGLLISIHLAYHHFSTLLYFRYLEVQRPTSSTYRTYIARCKSHASSFSSLLRQSRQLKGCDVVYPNIGHMATVSSSVLVHTLLFGDPDELDTVRQELKMNFEALIDLTQYWPSASAMIKRLVVFQDMCLLSAESGTYKVDGWMLRFLIEHSLGIKAERMQVNQTSSNTDSERISSRAKEFAEHGRYMSFRSPYVL